MVHLFPCDKELLASLQGEAPPSEEVRETVRAMKPLECGVCEGRVLHGNGWRNRVVLEDWNDWRTAVWYWRFECRGCGKSHCLMPEIIVPDLLYSAETVTEVVVERLNGRSEKSLEPHRRTQKRWLERMEEWFSVARAGGVICGALSEWAGSVSRLKEAILRCAASHVGLFFPSRFERKSSGTSPRRMYPAIATHQTCASTSVARM